jgi:hypothetical protein
MLAVLCLDLGRAAMGMPASARGQAEKDLQDGRPGLGDLTGRYATGSYSKLNADGRTVALRGDRQGAAEHRHRITAAIACHVARAGGTVDQLTRLLMHPDHEGGRHTWNIALRSRQPRALDHIRRVWSSATEAVSTTMALGARHDAYEV